MKKCLKCLKPLQSNKEYNSTGLHTKCYVSYFELKSPQQFSSFVRQAADKKSKPGIQLSVWNSSFFQGQFKKYSAILNGQSYIIKVN